MSEPTPLLPPVKPQTIAPRLWKAGRFVADAWRVVADGDVIPPGAAIIVPLARWRAERADLLARGAPTGVSVQPADVLDPAGDEVARVGLFALAFPKFSDGRAYSTARRLREVWGFEGEVRATGDVLLDQVPLMLRCGFDALEITNAATARALENNPIPAVSRIYQSVEVPGAVAWHSRRRVARDRHVEAAE